jgi:hypothetical protein
VLTSALESWMHYFAFFIPVYLLTKMVMKWVCRHDIFVTYRRTNLDMRLNSKEVY